MSLGLLYGQDLAVAAWCFKTWNRVPQMINRAFGIYDGEILHGGFIFSRFNGVNVELSIYSNVAPTSGMVKAMARFCLDELCVERVTILVPANSSLHKHILRAGGIEEAVMRRFYGRTDSAEHEAIQYALFSEQIARLAAYKKEVLH